MPTRVMDLTVDPQGQAPCQVRTVDGLASGPGVVVLGQQAGAAVALDTIAFLSVFKSRDGIIMLLIPSDTLEAVVVDLRAIAYDSFPGVRDDNAWVTCRNLVRFLCQACPNLIIDVGTRDFAQGHPVKSWDFPHAVVVRSAFSAVRQRMQPTAPLVSRPSKQASSEAPATMQCPKCGHSQPRAAECAQCGIVIAKFLEKRQKRGIDSDPASPGPEAVAAHTTQPGANAGEPEPTPSVSTSQFSPDETEQFMTLDAIYSSGVSLFRRHGWKLIAIAAPCLLLMPLVMGMPIAISAFAGSTPPGIIPIILSVALGTIMLSFCQRAIVALLYQSCQQGHSGVLEALSMACSNFGAVIASRFVSLVLMMMGFIAFIVPGVIYFVRYCHIEAISVIEKPQPLLSYAKMSHNLMTGHGFTVFAYVMATNLIVLQTIHLVSLASAILLPILNASQPSLFITAILGFGLFAILFLSFAAFFIAFATLTFIQAVELREIQGRDLYRQTEGMSNLTTFVLGVLSLFALLFAIALITG